MLNKYKSYFDNLKLRKITIYFLVLFAITTIGISYALFTIMIQQSNTFNIIVGNIDFKLSSSELDENNNIMIEAGKSKIIDLNVTSLNDFSSSYKLYYKSENNNQIKVSYYKNDLYNGMGTLDAGQTIKIQIALENKSLKDENIQLGVQGGFANKPLILNQGKSIDVFAGDVVLTYNYTGSNPPIGFPTRDSNYMVRELICENAEAKWNFDDWKIDVVRIDNVAAICTVSFEEEGQKPNEPQILPGMIPVTYDGSRWIKADVTKDWYSYKEQRWANAVTVTNSSKNKYINASAGTEISMDDINTMWVWIPRYEYQYTNLGDQYAGGTQEQPGEIKINFVEGTSIKSTDELNYKIHPAFTFGEKELTGFWYAKFETSGDFSGVCIANTCNTSQVKIKPNAVSLRNRNISTFFYMAKSMQRSGDFGFNSDSGDLHLNKNSEWGAVAYLSQSKYGKIGNINYNGFEKKVSSNNCDQYITGIGGETIDSPISSESCQINTYETSNGQAASTTGNITGIYDMNGASNEYVMANDQTLALSGFIVLPNEKYYDRYTDSDALKACKNEICYGHALSETEHWYNSTIKLGTSFYWGMRTGIFSYQVDNGRALDSTASRLTYTP